MPRSRRPHIADRSGSQAGPQALKCQQTEDPRPGFCGTPMTSGASVGRPRQIRLRPKTSPRPERTNGDHRWLAIGAIRSRLRRHGRMDELTDDAHSVIHRTRIWTSPAPRTALPPGVCQRTTAACATADRQSRNAGLLVTGGEARRLPAGVCRRRRCSRSGRVDIPTTGHTMHGG